MSSPNEETIKILHDDLTRLRLTVKVQQDHISLLRRRENIPGEGWTRADGEEFHGKQAIQMQTAWWAKKFAEETGRLMRINEELRWRLNESDE